MNIRFLIFVMVIFAVLALSSAYVGYRWIARSAWAAEHRAVVWVTLGVFVFVQLLAPFLYRNVSDVSDRWSVVHWCVYVVLGIFSCVVFYTAAADLFLSVWRGLLHTTPVDVERRSFLVVGIMTLISAAVGTLKAIAGPRVYEVDLPLSNFPKEMDGFTIAQISDLHAGPTIRREYVEAVVAATNALKPDLIALTGDFVDGTVDQLRDVLAPLRNLQSKNGVYFVTGNHEYYWGVLDWLQEFRRLGVQVLLNEHVLIQRGGGTFVLAGVTDYHADRILPEHASDPAKALEGAPQDTAKILLAHQPASYAEASEAGYHLQLSGHTHGGQYFPWSLLVALFQRYYKGLNKHKNMWVYVNRGTGYWGPPMRFTVPSEITLLKLRAV